MVIFYRICLFVIYMEVPMAQGIMTRRRKRAACFSFRNEALFTSMQEHPLANHSESLNAAEAARPYMARILRAVTYIQENCLTARISCSLRDISQETGVSPYHFHRLFRSCCGMTPMQFARMCRIEHAKKHMAAGTRFKVVSVRCGFANVAHFSNCFKAQVGITPGAWLRSTKG